MPSKCWAFSCDNCGALFRTKIDNIWKCKMCGLDQCAMCSNGRSNRCYECEQSKRKIKNQLNELDQRKQKPEHGNLEPWMDAAKGLRCTKCLGTRRELFNDNRPNKKHVNTVQRTRKCRRCNGTGFEPKGKRKSEFQKFVEFRPHGHR